VGQVQEPRGQAQLIALDSKCSVSVPTLEALLEALANVVAELQAMRQTIDGHPVVAEAYAVALRARFQECLAEAISLERAFARADVLNDEIEPRIVDEAPVGLENNVIAEPLGLLVGIGVAANPGHQARVIDDDAIRLAKAQALAHPQRD